MEAANQLISLFATITLPTGINSEVLWEYFNNKYGEHYLLPELTDYYNTFDDTNIFYIRMGEINRYLKNLFNVNAVKYKRLIDSLNKDYDVLEPYYMDEEHSEGNKSSDTTMKYAQHIDTNSESSMDDTTNLYPTSNTQYGAHDDSIERDHDQSTTFKGDTFESGSDETHHRKDYRHGNIGNQTQADLILKEVELAENNVYDIISKDMAEMLCYKIFLTSC